MLRIHTGHIFSESGFLLLCRYIESLAWDLLGKLETGLSKHKQPQNDGPEPTSLYPLMDAPIDIMCSKGGFGG